MKNNDNLKIMTLPKIFKTKKTLFFFSLSILVSFALIQAKPTLAQGCPAGWCSMRDCIPDYGCVESGGVMNCVDGYKECINSQWVPTDKRQETPDKFHYSPMGGVSSLERFQEVLVECAKTGTTAQECFVGGPELMESGAPSGILPNTLNTVSTMLLGPVSPQYIAMAPSGAIGSLGNLIAGMYINPPASSVEYFADLGRNLGIVQPAYAQGVGFTGLRPILGLWKTFRNIAYLFFVVVFVIVGFAIMFRLKIDPQTVISIQNALPKVIVALILVTFSYAIAGLLIDLIYVFISLLFALFRSQLSAATSGGEAPIQSLSDLLGHNVFSASWYILGGFRFATAVGSGIKDIIYELTGKIPLVSTTLGVTGGAIMTAIFAIAIAFSMFKLFFSLLISYISIIVGVIFAPLMLMLEALPGQRGLSSWLKMMLSNIIVFPLTAAIFILGAILVRSFEPGGEPGWVAPFLGAGWGAEVVSPLIGMGIVLLAPSIIDMVKKAIGAPGLAGMGAGIIAPISAAGGVIAAPAGVIIRPVTTAYQKYAGERMLAATPLGRLMPPEVRKGYEKK